MGSLFSALDSASQSLKAFEQAIDVTQNNVTNANSPGYADQVPQMISQAFQPDSGLSGGVQEQTQDTRSSYADTAVQQQLSLQGMYQQLQTYIDAAANRSSMFLPPARFRRRSISCSRAFRNGAPIPATPTTNRRSSTRPSRPPARSSKRRPSSASIQTATTNDIQSTVAQINQDAATIQSYNEQHRSEFDSPTPD